MKRTLTRGRGVGRPAGWNGARLRAAREASEMSRASLAELLARRLRIDSMSPTTLAAWEASVNSPPRRAIAALERILNTSLE